MTDRTVWEVSPMLGIPSSKVSLMAHHGDKYDEMLVLDGNFEDYNQKRARAQELCDQLNGGRIDAADVMRTKVQLAQRLDEMIKALEFDGGPARSLLISMRHDLFSTDETPCPAEGVVRGAGRPVTFEHMKSLFKEWVMTPDQLAIIELDTKFVELGLDSLDMVEIIMCVEDEYGVEFSDDDLGEEGMFASGDKITTPRELLEVTKRKVLAK
jgi:acyl carrier protein